MATLQIPTDSVQPDHEFPIDLDGKTYLLRFIFNFRSLRWSMNVSTEPGELLIAGIPLTTLSDLLGRFVNPDLPPGIFFIQDISGNRLEMTSQESLGSTHILYYDEAGGG